MPNNDFDKQSPVSHFRLTAYHNGIYDLGNKWIGKAVEAKIWFFKNGQAVFSIGTLQEMIEFRDMEDDFGGLPFPKYDATQERYYSRIEGGRPFVIPATIQRH